MQIFPKHSLKKRTKTNKYNLCLFLLHFSLNHCLPSLLLWQMCFAQDQSSCILAKAREHGCADDLTDTTQNMQAAPGSTMTAVALPGKSRLVCYVLGICCCCLPSCPSICPQLGNHWQLLTLAHSHGFLPFLHIISHPSVVRPSCRIPLQGT